MLQQLCYRSLSRKIVDDLSRPAELRRWCQTSQGRSQWCANRRWDSRSAGRQGFTCRGLESHAPGYLFSRRPQRSVTARRWQRPTL